MAQMDPMIVYFTSLKAFVFVFIVVILGYVGGSEVFVLTEKHDGKPGMLNTQGCFFDGRQV